MPKDEHVAVLGRGAAVWNTWRAEHDEAPDLSQAGLRGLDLTGFDLTRADLREPISGEQTSVMRICQVPVWRVRTSSKRHSMAPISPGLISMGLNF